MRADRAAVAAAFLATACAGGSALPRPHAPAADVQWRTAAVQAMSTVHPAVTDASCRQVLRISVGGNRLRMRLSNAMSPTPLSLSAVTVGVRRGGGATVQAPQAVTVTGSRTVTIAPGAEVTTDPVALPTSAGQDVVVTFAVTGTARLSAHLVGAATGWCTAAGTGDHTTDTGGTAFRDAFRQGLVLEDVEVQQSSTTAPGLLAVGDSLSDPPLPPDTYQRWTDVVARLLPGTPVANAAIGGNRVVLPGGYGPTLVQRFDRDVLSRPGIGTLVLFAGTNDVSTGISARDLIDRLTELARQAKAAHLRVVLLTLAPAEHRPAANEVVRRAVNEWVRSTQEADLRVDVDGVVRDPSRPTRLLPSYDLGDGLHLSARGQRAVGEAVAAALRAS